MPTEDLRVELAKLVVSMGYIQRELEEAKTARKSQYEKMEEQSNTLTKLDSRMGEVEKSLKTQAPTIEEFITIKHKVQGAGTAGKWIWGSVGAVLSLIGLIVAAKSGLISLFMGK
jgi:DNA repair ATPase RecN